MLRYTGHPLVDVGLATIAAFVGKPNLSELTDADLEAAADYMEANYTVDPLKSFLTVAFPNSGFTQPAYEKRPEKRHSYARAVLRAFRAGSPTASLPCAFTGEPAVGVPLDADGRLEPGRTFRQHVPLLTGEGVINFYPYGDAGLPISGVALLAVQALPLGCAKVGGRLLAVHSPDPELTYRFAHEFLEHNKKAIHTAQLAGDKKMPEYPRRPGTLVVEVLLRVEAERLSLDARPASVTAYHLSNSGQGAALDIYHLPLEITAFLRTAMSAAYRQAWQALCERGWEVTAARQRGDGEDSVARYNVLYEDLFHLPADAARFIRRYFLRVPQRSTRPGDPRASYSVKEDVDLVSWKLVELFLRKVVHMDQKRIDEIRKLGDALAEHVSGEDDRHFFNSFLMARRYDSLRATLIRVNVARVKRGQPPVVAFEPFITVFEEGEDLPRSDWRLARDLVLIRMIEQLHGRGWLKNRAEDLAVPDADDSDE